MAQTVQYAPVALRTDLSARPPDDKSAQLCVTRSLETRL